MIFDFDTTDGGAKYMVCDECRYNEFHSIGIVSIPEIEQAAEAQGWLCEPPMADDPVPIPWNTCPMCRRVLT